MTFPERHKCPRWGKILSAIIVFVVVVLLLIDIRLWHRLPMALAIILIAIAVIGELWFYFSWPTGTSEKKPKAKKPKASSVDDDPRIILKEEGDKTAAQQEVVNEANKTAALEQLRLEIQQEKEDAAKKLVKRLEELEKIKSSAK